MPQSFNDAITLYMDHIRNECRLAKTTCTQYQSNLRLLLRWLETNGYADASMDVLNTDVLRRFQMDQCKNGLRPRRVHV